jgi:hypothetical protein
MVEALPTPDWNKNDVEDQINAFLKNKYGKTCVVEAKFIDAGEVEDVKVMY